MDLKFSFRNKRADIENEPRKDMILTAESDAVEVEAYRTIRTNLLFTLMNKTGCKKVLVTSSVSKEGKSTVCVNLAASIAQTNLKVLLIDCDLRKPRLHKFFKDKSAPGISNYLIGNNKIDDIIKTTGIPNLSVIYSGTIPPNPSELLGGAEFKAFIETLSQKFDYIIMDCPPLLEVSDSLEVSKNADGALLITRQNFTTHNFINQALSKFEFVNTKILGIILNDVENRKSKYYYRYYRYFNE